MRTKQQGFTLVEIAIVLVIVGLIIGGVLKGQEMISNAKVRNVIDQTSAFQTAIMAFQDRYRALPGDYSTAAVNIAGVTGGANGGNGDGSGLVGLSAAGAANTNENGLIWLHLAGAGFITGTFNGQAAANNFACPAATCPANAFGGRMMFAWGSTATGTANNSHEMRTGRNIPVGVLAEIDRKTDDGVPETGSFQTDNNNLATCRTGAGAASIYNVVGGQTDCAGVRSL